MQVKEHFENSGYTADGEPVDVQVTSDEETIITTVQSVTTGWNVQVRDLFNAHVIVLCILVLFRMANMKCRASPVRNNHCVPQQHS